METPRQQVNSYERYLMADITIIVSSELRDDTKLKIIKHLIKTEVYSNVHS